ncbi:cytochrome c [Thalassotalea aquiviva]|uniref:c-type cytochrome n=1 Tax=Thalassotalea aquiviva TaxID=3242415 RepID=UPI00352A81D1
MTKYSIASCLLLSLASSVYATETQNAEQTTQPAKSPSTNIEQQVVTKAQTATDTVEAEAQIDRAQLEAMNQRRQTLVAFCAPCHGAEGISPFAIYPNLAGLEQRYIYQQLQDYKAKKRENDIMQGMVQRLSDQDMRLLAQYYAQKRAPQPKPEPDKGEPSQHDVEH